MPRPYNFFQFSESGTTGNGIVSAYKGLLSGFFTPSGMFSTPRGHFNVIGDYVDDFGYVPTYSLKISGRHSNSGPDENAIDTRISGSFYPLNSGIASITIDFTGRVESGNKDSSDYGINVSGAVVTGDLDNPTYSLRPSGKISPLGLDNHSIYLRISGELSSQQIDLPTYSIIMSGNIFKYERDIVSLDIDFSSVTFSGFGAKVSDTSEDVSLLTIDFGSIIYSVAGR